MIRTLKPEERVLLKFMIEESGKPSLVDELDDAQVSDMADGGMGSIRFSRHASVRMGRVLCEAESLDSDAIPLDISINLDEEDHLFELDIWKVNFTPLRTYPSPSTLRFLDPKP